MKIEQEGDTQDLAAPTGELSRSAGVVAAFQVASDKN
jgi:hypothetical protein